MGESGKGRRRDGGRVRRLKCIRQDSVESGPRIGREEGGGLNMGLFYQEAHLQCENFSSFMASYGLGLHVSFGSQMVQTF